jgi:hypothetical protein
MVLVCLCGCASQSVSGPSSSWIARNGGVCENSDTARITAIASQFEAIVDRPFRVQVLANQTPGAWSWPSGEIFLSSRLMETLSDDELAAVVGHELGHLLCDRHVQARFALTGDRDDDPEIAADQVGLVLLDAIGMPRGALKQALCKISSDNHLNPRLRDHLQLRIRRIPRPV